MHCKIHLNPETGEMHSDGDHRVRHWIKDRMLAKERPAKTPETFRERVTAAWKILRHNVSTVATEGAVASPTEAAQPPSQD